jgi:hypothetical protein
MVGLCAGSGCVHRRAWASPFGGKLGLVHGPPWIAIASHGLGLPSRVPGDYCVRSSINDQLRTGTDKGNPTV